MNWAILLLLAAVDLVPGTTSTWTDGTYTWVGNPWCAEVGMLLQLDSPAIETGVTVPGLHCPGPGASSQYPANPDGSPCDEWYGKAPSIGACAPGPSGIPTPPPATSVATFLGETGEDIASSNQEGADGIKDVHVRLTNVPAAVTRVAVRGVGSTAVWASPYNGDSWIVAIRPQPDPSIVDLYFNYWSEILAYDLDLAFANGARQTVQTINGMAPPKMPTGFKLQ